jgi:hypothetical protein
MRGSRQPAVRQEASASQLAFRSLSRHRRSKLARAAHTTLVKADQWSRGDGAPADLASALENALHALQQKGAKKKAAAPKA